MGSLTKNIQLMLDLLMAPFLIIYFSCYTLMAFLVLSLILFFTVSVSRHLDLWQIVELASELESNQQDTE